MATATVFSNILAEIVEDLPGIYGAVFVDWEGEAVDSVANFRNTAVRLNGAHWGVIYNLAKTAFHKLKLGSPRELILSTAQQLVIIRRITDDYLVVVVTGDRTNLGRVLNRLGSAAEKIREEM